MISYKTKDWWRKEVFEKRLPLLKMRAKLTKELRNYFEERGFLEVETPALQKSPGLEPHLKAFKTELELPHKTQKNKHYYLHTSPEFTMKKLLVAGLPKIFQLTHVFRNEEWSSLHSPEFSMLEFYQVSALPNEIMELTKKLIQKLAQIAKCQKINQCDLSLPWQKLSVFDAFKNYAKIDIAPAFKKNPFEPDRAYLLNWVEKMQLHHSPNDRWEDLFFRLFLEKVEPYLGKNAPCFLIDYPISMAALARAKKNEPHLAERFELYIDGVELANGFGELTDPQIQRARFEKDMKLKKELYDESYPIDEGFIRALEHGMPEASGIALGFDRLIMLLTGAKNINEVLWAAVEL